MRIFFPSAAEWLTDTQGNGEGLIAVSLLTELVHRGHDVVACVRGQQLVAEPRFDIVEIGRGRVQSIDPFTYSREVARTLRSRGRRSFDVAHWLFPNCAPGFSISALEGLPLVVGPVMQPWPAARRWWPAGFAVRRALGPWFARRQARLQAGADAFLAVEVGARSQIPGVDDRRIHDVPFGVRVEAFVPAPLPRAPRILYLGTLEARKGVYDLLASMRAVSAARPDVTLTVAGTGPEEQGMRDAAGRLGIADAVEFAGHVPASDVPSLLARSSLLCLPSYGEPFGMVLLEAMAAGRAVVSTRAGGPASIVVDGSGGALVEPGDVKALGLALTALLTDDAGLAAAGEFNRARVEAEYSLESVVGRLERVYESIA